MTLVGLPAQKRIALSLASLKTACLISEELASMHSGAWISALTEGSKLRKLARAVAQEIQLAPRCFESGHGLEHCSPYLHPVRASLLKRH